MCFIASYLQSDLSDPTNHKLPYQRRISGLIGVVRKDRFIEYLFLNIFFKYLNTPSGGTESGVASIKLFFFFFLPFICS